MQTITASNGRKHLLSTSGITKQGARNDCSVRALANAGGIPYETAEAIHARNGRKHNAGCTVETVAKTYGEAGFELQGVYGDTKQAWFLRNILHTSYAKDHKGTTLAKFVQQNNKGKYICLVRGHAFAVVDGAIIDNQHLLAGKRVIAVFKPVDNSVQAMLEEME